MIITEALWELGKELKYLTFGKKEVTRYNKKMTSLSIQIKTDINIDGWEAEAHFLPPAVKISREFVRLSAAVEENKVSFALENTVTSQMGEWQIELVLLGPSGERYGSKDRLKYVVVETANALSLNEKLNEADSSTVDAAKEGLELALTEVGTKQEEIIKTADKKVEEIKTTEGMRGQQGIQGEHGIQGVQGEQGIDGDKGDTGEKGLQGTQGVAGENGSQGVPGIQGVQGLKGDKGDKGDPGNDGVIPQEQLNQIQKNKEDIAKQGEQLQNCLQELDSSLVAVISDKGISSNVTGKNVINTGSNAIEGEGISFVKSEDGFGIGEGYENIFNKITSYGSEIHSKEDLGNGRIKLKFSGNAQSYGGVLSISSHDSQTFPDGTITEMRLRVVEVGAVFIGKSLGTGNTSEHAYFFKNTYATNGGDMHSIVKWKKQSGGGKNFTLLSGYFANIDFNPATDYIILEDVQVVKRNYTAETVEDLQNNVPFVPHSFKGGELSINEPWTSKTHTFLGIGFKKNSVGNSATYLQNCAMSGSAERVTATINDFDSIDYILSDTVQVGIPDTGPEFSVAVVQKGITTGSIKLNYPYYWSSHDFVCWAVFEGDLGEVKAREMLALIKSGNYTLPPHMQGTILPIEGMIRRGDKYGIVKDHINVTDYARDLWYVDGEATYEIIDNNLVVHYVRVNADLSLTGTALEDVSERLRVAKNIALPAKVRRIG